MFSRILDRLFPARAKRLFTFRGPRGTVYRADPWPLYRSLLSNPKYDLAKVDLVINAELEPDASQVFRHFAECLGVERFADTGGRNAFTDQELYTTVEKFIDYLQLLKKSIETSRLSSLSTDSPPYPPHLIPEDDTNSFLDSGETSNTSDTAPPSPFCKPCSP